MQNYTLTPVVAVSASEKGALPGFKSVCSCGLVMKSSLRTLLEADRVAHLAYHAKKDGGR